MLERGYDAGVSGATLSETTLNTSNVVPGSFGLVFKLFVNDNIMAQPLYVPNVVINQVAHNVLYVATMSDTLYGFDADVGGAPLWTRDLAALVGATPVPIAKFAISGATVSFGGSAATSVVVVNARKITARTPPHKKDLLTSWWQTTPMRTAAPCPGDLHTTTNTDSLCCGWHCGCYPHCGGCILR